MTLRKLRPWYACRAGADEPGRRGRPAAETRASGERPLPLAPARWPPPTAACLEWTDGCRVCQRAPNGEASCSNVGIACVPKAEECTRR